ncbi:MAG: hypothetical protein KJO54_12525 [Gammaproteobacteria bacterium]|nr:hypothetical protein [Gammaproteobacteria bacterium]NNF62595.1 hypothetical protein [Gammaproteobacteria bacterium]NNM20172.1 hypothetical protein [Gammaproteobacteria bacterium]
MQALITFVLPFVQIVAHRAGPQHLPASRFLLALVLALHIAVYYAAMVILEVPAARAVALPFVDTLTQSVCFAAVLLFLGLQGRMLQTLTAVFGADVLLNLLQLPLAVFGPLSSGSPAAVVSLLLLIAIALWSLGVKGHILRHAAGLPYFVGVALALVFLIGFLAIEQALFGGTA